MFQREKKRREGPSAFFLLRAPANSTDSTRTFSAKDRERGTPKEAHQLLFAKTVALNSRVPF
jgi:hypothetical protein